MTRSCRRSGDATSTGTSVSGKIYGAKLRTSGVKTKRVAGLPTVSNLASFGQDTQGRIYVVSLNGTVSRLAAR